MTGTTTDEIDRLAKLYSKSELSESGKLLLVLAIVRANEKPIAETARRYVPVGYSTLAEIQNSLVNRMWAGFGSAELASKILRDAEETNNRRLSFGPRRARVAAALEKAFRTGKLTLYAAADPTRLNPLPSWAKDPIPVPKRLVGHVFIKVPDRMPSTFAIRPNRRVVGDDRLFALIERCTLVVQEREFRGWLRSQRKKAKVAIAKNKQMRKKSSGATQQAQRRA